MRAPIVLFTLAFGAGLTAGLVPFLDPRSIPIALGVSAVIAGVSWRSYARAPRLALVIVVISAGALWGAAAQREQQWTCVGQWTTAGKATHALTVRLIDPVSPGGEVVGADPLDAECEGEVPLRWPADSTAQGGTTWLVSGRWLSEGDGTRGVLRVSHARVLGARPRGRGGVRNAISVRVRALFGSRAPLVDALVIARRNALDPEVRERFAQAGLAHLLCVAGLHVGFLAGWLSVLLRRLPLSPAARYITGALLILSYVWLLGFPPPATRAGVGLAVLGYARLRQRLVPPLAVLSLTALILLLFDPFSAHSVGAWLSFAAVGAVFAAVRATAGAPWYVRVTAPGVAATLVTAPITAFAFGTVAPIGVLVNLIAIPLAGIAIPGAMLAIMVTAVAPPLGALLARGAGLGLALLDGIAGAGDRVPLGHVVMTAGPAAALTWLLVLAVAWWLWRAPRRRWIIAARALFVATIIAWSAAFRAPSLDDCRCLAISFLDVGQGDAAALRTPGGQWIVIDGGPRIPGNDAGRRVVVPYLRRHGAHRLALMISTHSDADHLGGLPAVVAAFPPHLVIEPGEPLARPLYFEFLAAVEGAGSRWRAARAGDRITLDSVVIQVLSPDEDWMGVPVDVNDHGVVVLVTYGTTRVLFQADAGVPVEQRLAGTVGHVDLLKVGHHGSRSASSEEWLAELSPPVAVISVGARNRYGHPAPEVLERLAGRGIRILRTDQRGTITFTSDGHNAPRDIGHHD
ncbi:MAG TPA: DNA internalization-related competence protein ComEC/Rec2 [Gemmatimonadales bacterium]|nr:DNA internalization-related competence protein ComEC/Rec2 [Gemmatimonadales bacterium]